VDARDARRRRLGGRDVQAVRELRDARGVTPKESAVAARFSPERRRGSNRVCLWKSAVEAPSLTRRTIPE
jgi:hypothetical protein